MGSAWGYPLRGAVIAVTRSAHKATHTGALDDLKALTAAVPGLVQLRIRRVGDEVDLLLDALCRVDRSRLADAVHDLELRPEEPALAIEGELGRDPPVVAVVGQAADGARAQLDLVEVVGLGQDRLQ